MKTIDEINATRDLAVLKADAIDALNARTLAESVADSTEAEKVMKAAIERYNNLSKEAVYGIIKESENPMVCAVLMWDYPTIRCKETHNSETNTTIAEIDDSVRSIDLADLHKAMNGGSRKLGADPNWLYTAQNLNFNLTFREAREIGDTALAELLQRTPDIYKMKKLARAIQLHIEDEDNPDPTSNTTLLRALDLLIKQMLGEEYTATRRDLQILLKLYLSNDRKSPRAVSAASHKQLYEILKKVCRRIITGEECTLTSREIKKER